MVVLKQGQAANQDEVCLGEHTAAPRGAYEFRLEQRLSDALTAISQETNPQSNSSDLVAALKAIGEGDCSIDGEALFSEIVEHNSASSLSRQALYSLMRPRRS